MNDVNHVHGTAGADTLTIGEVYSQNGTTIDLGDGDDTIAANGNFVTFSAIGVEHITGNGLANFVTLTSQVNGLTVDLGDSGDNLNLANGTNSVSVVNVESINGSDFIGAASDDTLTLQTTVSGVSVNLGQGTNTLNLAAGSSSFNNLFNVSLLSGTASDDTVILSGQPAQTVDLGAGDDTLDMGASYLGMFGAVSNTETIVGASASDNITIVNAVDGHTTITAGFGIDNITASAGHDNFRFTSTSDSGLSGGDTITNFDAANDTFTFSGMSIAGDHIEFVDNGGALLGGNQASAHVVNNGPGNDQLQIDVDGNGISDMEVSLQNVAGTLHNGSFLLS
jgi:Ca2+-binding RTX toxin-like protein